MSSSIAYILLIIFTTTYTQALTCDTYTANTCLMTRTTQWNMTNDYIECSQDAQYPNCIITCSDEAYSCGNDKNNNGPIILCPINGNECIINCLDPNSCSGATIESNNCSSVHIIIDGVDMQRLEIYAPNNNGILNITLTSPTSTFIDSYIYTTSNTSNVILNCNKGNQCNNIILDGSPINGGDISFECNGESIDCNNNTIYCPYKPYGTNNKCNIDCIHCVNLNVYAIQGIYDVNWRCINNSNSCNSSYLHCKTDLDGISDWKYIDNEWILTGDCIEGIISTYSPLSSTITTELQSISPTSPTEIMDTNFTGFIENNYPSSRFQLIAALSTFFITIICCLFCCLSLCLIRSWRESSKLINETEMQLKSMKASTNTTSSTLENEPIPNDAPKHTLNGMNNNNERQCGFDKNNVNNIHNMNQRKRKNNNNNNDNIDINRLGMDLIDENNTTSEDEKKYQSSSDDKNDDHDDNDDNDDNNTSHSYSIIKESLNELNELKELNGTKDVIMEQRQNTPSHHDENHNHIV